MIPTESVWLLMFLSACAGMAFLYIITLATERKEKPEQKSCKEKAIDEIDHKDMTRAEIQALPDERTGNGLK